VPVDSKKPMNQEVKAQIEALLRHPNPMDYSYSQLKEMSVEDYLVIGQGAMEKQNYRDGRPYRLYPLDGARLAFIAEWDGEDQEAPRYAYLDPDFIQLSVEEKNNSTRWLKNRHAVVMVNTERSYDLLGLSHVEILIRIIMGLLEGDDYLYTQIAQAAPNGALTLGRGISKQQVEDLRQQIASVRRAFVILGNMDNPQYIPFSATAREMQVLDSQEWFVRQVAAVFNLSTASLKLAVDTSRANTESMSDDDDEGLIQALEMVRDIENAQIVETYGPPEEHNCMIDYPILNRKDALKQAQIGQIQGGNQAFATPNEIRTSNGLEALPNPAANEVWLNAGKGIGLIALSQLDQQLQNDPDGDDHEENPEAGEGSSDDSKNPPAASDEDDEDDEEDEDEKDEQDKAAAAASLSTPQNQRKRRAAASSGSDNTKLIYRRESGRTMQKRTSN
jgi:hypothetical protein